MGAASCLLALEASVAGPAVRLNHRCIIVANESQDAVLQILKREKRSVAGEFSSQGSEPDLDLIEPTTVLRCVDETDAMAGVAQELATSLERLQTKSSLRPAATSAVPYSSTGNTTMSFSAQVMGRTRY